MHRIKSTDPMQNAKLPEIGICGRIQWSEYA